MSEYYTLSSSDIISYESSLLPLKNLSSFATTLLILVLSIGAVILIVINVFNIRERKYEVGVLTAIGIKKGRVAMQFVAELLFVTLLFIFIGAGVGAAVSSACFKQSAFVPNRTDAVSDYSSGHKFR